MTAADVWSVLLAVYAVAITGTFVILAVAVRLDDPDSRIGRSMTNLVVRMPYILRGRVLWTADSEALSDEPVPYWPAYLPNARVQPELDHQGDELAPETETE